MVAQFQDMLLSNGIEKMQIIIYSTIIVQKPHGTMMSCFVSDIKCLDRYSFVLLMQSKVMTITSNNEEMGLEDLDYQPRRK